VNRVGEGGGLRYDGGTRIVDPMGVVVSADGGELCLAHEVDPAVVARVRDDLPFLQDRR
jgi:predicted amidohydrolase